MLKGSWKVSYRVKKDTDIPLVMTTTTGTVHVIAKGSKQTLCRKNIGPSRWGSFLKKSKFRVLGKSDGDHMCGLCYGRLEKAEYPFPWAPSVQTLHRLEGLGLNSAEAVGEFRVSVSIEEMDTLISMIRRGT